MRPVNFIYKTHGVNRPLRANEDDPRENLNHSFYRDQINKVANAVKELISGLTVDYKGNFSTFSPGLIAQKETIYGDFVLGNVLHDSFVQAASTNKFHHIYEDLVKGLRKCKNNCGYYGLCSAGTPSNKLSEHQTLDTDETLPCRLVFQTPIDTVLQMIDEEQE